MTAYVIDNHPIMREMLTMLIQRIKPSFKFVPLDKITALDCAVLKIGVPQLICMQLPDPFNTSDIERLRATYPETQLAVICSSEFKFDDYVGASLNAGADVFIHKSEPVRRILSKLAQLLVKENAQDKPQSGASTSLTKRQKQLILTLDQGFSNREIADNLGISEHSVKVHLWRMFQRLGVHSRTEALHFARENGLLRI